MKAWTQLFITESKAVIDVLTITNLTWSSCFLLLGVHSVAYAFPKVQIVTTAVDADVNEKFHIVPGIGRGRLTMIYVYV